MRAFLFVVVIVLVVVGAFLLYGEFQKNNVVENPTVQNPDDEDDDFEEIPDESVLTIIKSKDNLSEIFTLIDTSNLKNQLTDATGYTLFLPRNEALEINSQNLTEEQKEEILRKHIILGRFSSLELASTDEEFKNLNNETIDIKIENGAIVVNNIEVIEVDLQGKEGYIHIIDGVIQ